MELEAHEPAHMVPYADWSDAANAAWRKYGDYDQSEDPQGRYEQKTSKTDVGWDQAKGTHATLVRLATRREIHV